MKALLNIFPSIHFKVVIIALNIYLLSSNASSAQNTRVDLQLILAVDCSYSISDTEYQIQMRGLAKAIRSPDVLLAIQTGEFQQVAISLLQWSGTKHQTVAIPWTKLKSKASILSLASRIERIPRSTPLGSTSISAVIAKSIHMFNASPYVSVRRVIDISGDGRNNDGVPPHFLRDVAIKKGITINGLAIVHEIPTLHHYYRNKVIGGQDSFVIKANSFQAYEQAIRDKLVKEIGLFPIALNDY